VSRIRVARFLIVLVLITSAGTTMAQARLPAGGKLTFRLGSAYPPMRSDAPFSVTCVFTSTFSEVLSGEIDLALVDDGVVCVQLTSDQVVVPQGESSFRLALPPVSARRNPAAFTLRAAFRSAKGLYNLGSHDLIVPLRGRRQFVIGAPGLNSEAVGRLATRLRLDAFRPSPADSSRSDLVSTPIDLDVWNLPTQSIGLYPYNLLLLAGDSFSRLSERQLDAVANWVEEGGCAVVVPTGVLTPSHQHFLVRMTSRETEAPLFALDQFGRLIDEPAGSRRRIRTCRCGFGRALILSAVPAFKNDGSFREITEPEWIRAVCFIWSVRDEQLQAILKTGIWNPPPEPKYHDDVSLLRPRKFSDSDGLRLMLFPRAVRVMPFGVVVALLTLFALAVGPGDYYLHGLRLRWLRWLAFPTTCLSFTVATVWIAGRYTGRVDHRTSLSIVDLGLDGTPRRTSRIEHVVTAETRMLACDVRSGIFAWTDVQPGDLGNPSPDSRATTTYDDSALYGFEPIQKLTYTGTLPTNFTVTRLAPQWTPSMHRVTRPSADVSFPALDWSDLDALDLASEGGRKTLAERLRRAEPACELLLQNASQRFVCKSGDLFEPRDATSRGWAGILAALARRSDSGLFSIVSHVAPDGAGNLEDLSVSDVFQPDVWLLQCALHRGDDLIVCRRVMRRKSTTPTEHPR
jgi:hypothetical protein